MFGLVPDPDLAKGNLVLVQLDSRVSRYGDLHRHLESPDPGVVGGEGNDCLLLPRNEFGCVYGEDQVAFLSGSHRTAFGSHAQPSGSETLDCLGEVEPAARHHLVLEGVYAIGGIHDLFLDQVGSCGGVLGEHEGRRSRHVRRGHGGAAQASRPAVVDQVVNVDSGGGQIHRGLAVAGEGGELVVLVACRHRNDV